MDAVEMNNAAQVRTPVLERDEVLRRDKTYWFWRRVQDILLSVLGLAILWPFMLIVAVVIVIDSPGAENIPIFALICSISYMMSGKTGLYKSQTIVYSKISDDLSDFEVVHDRHETPT